MSSSGNEETEEPEVIIGHNFDDSQTYLVKFHNSSYQKCRWVSKAELEKTPKSKLLLQNYISDPSIQRTEPPFFDQNYTHIDRIISIDNGRYLVKWQKLLYDNLTYEDNVPKRIKDQFAKRKNLRFPNSQNQEFPKIDYTPISEITFKKTPFDYFKMELFNLIFENFSKGITTQYQEQFGFRSISPICAFLQHVYEKHSTIGPYLIITTSDSIDNWNDDLSRLPLTTLIYAGSHESRENAYNLYFYGAENKLCFHVLLTTGDAFTLDIARFEEITWQCVFVDQPTIGAHLRKSIKQLKVNYTAEIERDTGFVSELTASANAVFDEETEYHRSSGQEKTVAAFIIDPPLCEMQRRFVRDLVYEHDDDIKAGKFGVLAHKVCSVARHPFILYGGEAHLGFSDIRESSSVFAIIDIVIQSCVEQKKHFLISTSIPELSEIASDYLIEKGIHVPWPAHSSENDIGLAQCSVLSPVLPPLARFDIVIVLDSHNNLFQKWMDHVNAARNDLEHSLKLYLFRTMEDRYVNNSNLRKNDFLMRHAAFEAFDDGPIPTPEEALETAIELDVSSGIVAYPKTFVDLELMGPSFWDTVPENEEESPIVPASPITDDHVWTVRERNTFIRALFAICWGHWSDMRLAFGLNMSEETIAAAAMCVLNKIKESNKELFFLGTEKDMSKHINAELAASLFAEPYFINIVTEHAPRLQRRIAHLHFLHVFTQNKAFEDMVIPNITKPSPAKWWTQAHDKALVRGTLKYGLQHYENFSCDANSDIRAVVKVRKTDPQWYAVLSYRLGVIVDEVKRLMVDDTDSVIERPPNIAGFEDIPPDDVRKIVDALMNFGIRLDENGAPSYSLVAKDAGVEIDSVRLWKFIETLLLRIKKGEYSDMKPGIAIKLMSHVNAMYKLRELLRSTHVTTRTMAKVPHWNGMPESWHGEVELTFLRMLEEKGFGQVSEILKDPEISSAFEDGKIPDNLNNHNFILKRITELSGALHIRPGSSSQQAVRPPPTKVVNPDEIEYPIMITSTSSILNLGHIVYDREGFHTERYIYPAGFKSSRFSTSISDPDHRTRWISEIVDTGEVNPQFRVWQEDDPTLVFTGMTPTAPWSQALRAVANARSDRSRVASISGPEAFMLAAPLTVSLIQQLPNANKCTRYIWKNPNLPANKHDDSKGMQKDNDDLE